MKTNGTGRMHQEAVPIGATGGVKPAMQLYALTDVERETMMRLAAKRAAADGAIRELLEVLISVHKITGEVVYDDATGVIRTVTPEDRARAFQQQG